MCPPAAGWGGRWCSGVQSGRSCCFPLEQLLLRASLASSPQSWRVAVFPLQPQTPGDKTALGRESDPQRRLVCSPSSVAPRGSRCVLGDHFPNLERERAISGVLTLPFSRGTLSWSKILHAVWGRHRELSCRVVWAGARALLMASPTPRPWRSPCPPAGRPRSPAPGSTRFCDSPSICTE